MEAHVKRLGTAGWAALPWVFLLTVVGVAFAWLVGSLAVVDRHFTDSMTQQEATRIGQFAEQKRDVERLIAESEARKLRLLLLLARAAGVTDAEVEAATTGAPQPPVLTRGAVQAPHP
jgi:deoxyinosine 3'endonuclease (endonuclease V)